jgi:hypothetical protein
MLARWTAPLLVGFGLFISGCDAGESTFTPPAGDPNDQGNDEDLGSGDDVLEETPVAANGHLKVEGGQLRNEAGDPIQL